MGGLEIRVADGSFKAAWQKVWLNKPRGGQVVS